MGIQRTIVFSRKCFFFHLLRSSLIQKHSTRSCSFSAKNDQIQFRIPPARRHPEVIDFVLNNFFIEEPLSKCLNIMENEDDANDCRNEVAAAIEFNMSVMAVDADTDRILGVLFSRPTFKHEFYLSLSERYSAVRGSKSRQVERLCHMLYSKLAPVDPFDEMETDCLFELKGGMAAEDQRGNGLHRELIRRSLGLGKLLGFKGCITEATNIYSRKGLEQNGMVVRAELPFNEYSDEEGTNVFESLKSLHNSIVFLTLKF